MLKFTLRQFNSIYKLTTLALPKNGYLSSGASPYHTTKKPYITATWHKTQTKDQPRSTHVQEESEYLVRTQHDPDVFGSNPHEEKLDELDIKEETYISNPRQHTKRLNTKQYADIIKELIRKKKIQEAIEVVEIRMLQEDRVKPENYIYNLLLGACGRVGYTKKAFSLFNDMKRRGLKVHPGAYTALFNACANSPWQEDGLSRARHLHNLMIEKSYQPNDTNYNAMIKAYGRCGDINAAFSIVDEMVEKQFVITCETINFLMQGCISDKEAGFRHAILVWRKLIEKRIEPTTFSYNLLLRVTRDCGLGDLEATKDVLKKILPETENSHLQLESGENSTEEIVEDTFVPLTATGEIPGGKLELASDFNLLSNDVINRPNLLAETPHLGDMMLLKEITKAEDRLLLLGGAKNLLEDMKKHECSPDIKTYTQLLDCLPSTLTAEKELLLVIKKNRVWPDLDFYNMLIKKRSMRFDYEGARDVLYLIEKAGLIPDLITYGILALGCKTAEEAQLFLHEMSQARYRLNAEILGAMLQQSTFHADFPYVLFVMEQCIVENIQPNPKFMEHLENFYKKCKRMSNDSSTNSLGKTRKFVKGYQTFRMRLKTWKLQVTPEEDVHPWQQFRQPVTTDVEHYKEDNKSRFKPRHLNKFKQKTEIVNESEKSRRKLFKYNNRNHDFKKVKRFPKTKTNTGEFQDQSHD